MLWFLGTGLSAEHAGSTLQQRDTVAVQSAFTGKNAYSGKNSSADSSECASLTCTCRSDSVIFRQKCSAQREGAAVFLTAFQLHPVPPNEILFTSTTVLLFTFYVVSGFYCVMFMSPKELLFVLGWAQMLKPFKPIQQLCIRKKMFLLLFFKHALVAFFW